jgi:hypothetical protein
VPVESAAVSLMQKTYGDMTASEPLRDHFSQRTVVTD